MAQVPLAEVDPQTAATLRAVYRVSRAARTAPQRDAAARITNRWTALALEAGWTNKQIAEVVGAHHSLVTRRAAAHRSGGKEVPALLGVVGLDPAPRSLAAVEADRRSRLIAAGEVARLVGCAAGSVPSWAQTRGVAFEWSAGGGRRLYDRDVILEAAQARPTVTHRKHRPRRVRPTPPARRLTGTKSTWAAPAADLTAGPLSDEPANTPGLTAG